MSLINDALKQAKAAQSAAMMQDRTLALRPAETAARGRQRWYLVVPAALGLVAVTGVAMLWWAAHQTQLAAVFPPIGEEISVRARSTQSPAPAEPRPPQENVPVAQPMPVATPELPSLPDSEAETGKEVVPPFPAEPAVPALRLQGIVAHPTRPSALINGHVFFLGDRVDDLHLSEIKSDRVILSGGGAQKELHLGR